MSIGADHDPARVASGCPVCAAPAHTVDELAVHLVERAGASDVAHVMWLNRNVTKHRVDAPGLAELLRATRGGTGGSASADRVNR